MTKIVLNKPLIISFYGYPGSGKTFLANQLKEHLHAAYLNSEKIRYELFEKPKYDIQENNVIKHLMDYMSEEFITSGLSVIYDVASYTKKDRILVNRVAKNTGAEHLTIWLQIDQETAYYRCQLRDKKQNNLVNSRPLSEKQFNEILASMQNPTEKENYLVTSGKHVFSTQFAALTKKLNDLRVINIEDASKHIAKPNLVNRIPNPYLAGRVNMDRRRNIIIR